MFDRAKQESLIAKQQQFVRAEVHELVRGVFGDVPNIGRLAEWLHALSGGNPQACMDLARHLVEAQVIRFKDGVWGCAPCITGYAALGDGAIVATSHERLHRGDDAVVARVLGVGDAHVGKRIVGEMRTGLLVERVQPRAQDLRPEMLLQQARGVGPSRSAFSSIRSSSGRGTTGSGYAAFHPSMTAIRPNASSAKPTSRSQGM